MSLEIIEEQGIVRSVGAGVVKVEITRPSCATGGAACSACTCGEEGRMILDVETDLNLTEGQEVTVQIEQQPLLSAVFLVFVMPLAFLLAGMAMGHVLFGPWGALVGVVLCASSFVLVYLYDRRLRRLGKGAARIVSTGESH